MRTGKWTTGRTLSPVIDTEEDNHSSWAITQQHGRTVNKPGSRNKQSPEGGKPKDGKAKPDPKSKITLPVLGSLSMKIETQNPFDSDKKEHLDMLYRNKLLRTKKHKSIQGMFQAAKANKELSQVLLNMNPSFNLDIGEHDLHKFLAPNRHIPPHHFYSTQVEDVGEAEAALTEELLTELTETLDEVPSYDTTVPLTPATAVITTTVVTTSSSPSPPLPLTANDLIRRSKVIDAVTPSTFWKPLQSVSQ